MRTLLGFSLLALMVAGAAGTCAHAQTYPARPVTFVVPFAPGGGTEFLARLLGQRLEQRLGKPFVIENRPGGGGVTGAFSVARAAPAVMSAKRENPKSALMPTSLVWWI